MSALDDTLAADLKNIGTEVGVSDWITVTQEMIDEFAKVTLDDQWIHVDPARAAAETPFGGTIAHGFLTLSLASRMFYDCFAPLPGQAMGINYGFDKLRFLAPVCAGARIRGRFVLSRVRKRSETELLRVHDLTVDIEKSEVPALVASWLGLTVFHP
ncbi:nodulation protein NodN [Ruegeria marisrubri]|uniref:Nodulation protein NodN n=1 Tax=Ruegeria marisrubri TaxID=1685379 RepID=A0A101CZ66_9RHOB|nr:MaoC family dehydratase [Ruegeria marisrubri]KUJ86022.1 nodulation protein NodN [Ruegeria marisrubri]